jgi:hypothetical protein
LNIENKIDNIKNTAPEKEKNKSSRRAKHPRALVFLFKLNGMACSILQDIDEMKVGVKVAGCACFTYNLKGAVMFSLPEVYCYNDLANQLAIFKEV